MGLGFTVGILADWTDISTPARLSPDQIEAGIPARPRYRYIQPDDVGFASGLAPIDRPSWSYGGFGRFRERLCAAAGQPDPSDLWESGEVGDPALEPLIWHSDCEGILLPDECRQVAPRLRELLDHSVFHQPMDTGYDQEHGALLADLMDLVANHPSGRIALVFC